MRQSALPVLFLFLLNACAELAPDTAGGSRSRGYTVFLWNSRNSFEPGDFTTAVQRMQTSGANTIILCPYYFVTDRADSFPRPGAETISDTDLSNAIGIIRTNGLKYGIKPHINCLDGTARFLWDPTNRQAALEHYSVFITNYAVMASNLQADYFIAGTELDRVANIPEFFHTVIARIRKVYPGPVTYAASYNHFASVSFWDDCDYLGVNAWFYLSDARTPQVPDLLNSWKSWVTLLTRMAGYHNKRVFITEIGYINTDYCAINPGDWTIKDRDNQMAQANCYRAALEVFERQPLFHGITIWNWELNTGGSPIMDFTPEAKTAETAITAIWRAP